MICTHTKWIYSLDYSSPYSYSTHTSGGGTCYLNRYCADCQSPLGSISGNEVEALTEQFTSPELDTHFAEKTSGYDNDVEAPKYVFSEEELLLKLQAVSQTVDSVDSILHFRNFIDALKQELDK